MKSHVFQSLIAALVALPFAFSLSSCDEIYYEEEGARHGNHNGGGHDRDDDDDNGRWRDNDNEREWDDRNDFDPDA